MFWRKTLVAAVACYLFSGMGPVRAEEYTEHAIEAARQFLTLMDAGGYGPAWESTAAVFRAENPRERWEIGVVGMRPLFGELLRRSLLSAVCRETLPGMPDGEYVVVLYETVFAGKAAGREVVIPVLEPDGQWRVAVYSLR